MSLRSSVAGALAVICMIVSVGTATNLGLGAAHNEVLAAFLFFVCYLATPYFAGAGIQDNWNLTGTEYLQCLGYWVSLSIVVIFILAVTILVASI